MPIASPFRLLTSRPGNQNDSGATWALARTFPENCMTPKPVQTFIFFHFRSHPNRSQERLVFPRVLPMKTAAWLGAESNRRHVDFQSTALPTELPSRFILCDAAPFSSGVPTMAQSRCRARPSIDVLIRFESYNRHLQKTISITNAPAAIGQYSQMVRTGGFFLHRANSSQSEFWRDRSRRNKRATDLL